LKAVHIHHTDLELISLYKESGDNVHIGELFKRYTHLVFGVCMKYLKDEDESKDAVMMIFEKLPADLRKHEVTQFKGWLHTVARNHCLMELRSKSVRHEKEVEMAKDFASVMESSYELHLDGEADKEKELSNLESAVQELKEEQKICIELFYLQEKSYQEVAEMTGFDMNKVKSAIQNGKRNLKILLTERNERQVS
jgi:RNA polymerase sigma-70 factor, ECF subfamily